MPDIEHSKSPSAVIKSVSQFPQNATLDRIKMLFSNKAVHEAPCLPEFPSSFNSVWTEELFTLHVKFLKMDFLAGKFPKKTTSLLDNFPRFNLMSSWCNYMSKSDLPRNMACCSPTSINSFPLIDWKLHFIRELSRLPCSPSCQPCCC